MQIFPEASYFPPKEMAEIINGKSSLPRHFKPFLENNTIIAIKMSGKPTSPEDKTCTLVESILQHAKTDSEKKAYLKYLSSVIDKLKNPLAKKLKEKAPHYFKEIEEIPKNNITASK